MSRLAIVLFNLGGPDKPAAIRPFLFNLFNDKAIIGAPLPIRWLLAQLISRRRVPAAKKIYQHLGGASPLLRHTEAQARALEIELQKRRIPDVSAVKTFIAMRYWHPLSPAAVRQVKQWDADQVLLLPLYPQFSAATSGSSINAWKRAATTAGLAVETKAICCYPTSGGFPEAQAGLIAETLAANPLTGPIRLLFSAHGLPRKMIDAADPYQAQIEASAAAIARVLQDLGVLEKFQDWRVAYQSRVGPLEWLQPYMEDEIRAAGGEGLNLMVVPVAFVSEHSETLVELDRDYRDLALNAGVPGYLRAPTVLSHPYYISGLADLVERAQAVPVAMQGLGADGDCPRSCGQCPRRIMALAE